MRHGKMIIIAAILLISLFIGVSAFTAYNHDGDTDSVNFRAVYPTKVGTKLDSCTLCHGGGSYTSNGKTTTLGSCQWCHYITNYGDNPENLPETLNPYGIDYQNNGRDTGSLGVISTFDSDEDTYSNEEEISAGTYPGDENDDPSNVPAPSIVLSLTELEWMPPHTQFLLMNASKSDDSYTEYSGVALESLIKAVMVDTATGITVYSPDGWATYHPFNPSDNPNSYHVFGAYPEGTFYYDERADIALYPPDPPDYETGGWCNYSSPSATGRETDSAISNPADLKLMLAFERDGEYLTPGVLNSKNKLDGEGPFRVVPPQKDPGWPDQRSSSTNQSVVWPYNSSADHNAGFSSRTVTMIKVEPLPEGTTDIDVLEAGWPYVDANMIIIYGSINSYPVENLNTHLDELIDMVESLDMMIFNNKSHQKALVNKIEAIKNQVATEAYSGALRKLKEDVLKKMDGYLSGGVDGNDWIDDLEVQKQLNSEIQIIWIDLVILGG